MIPAGDGSVQGRSPSAEVQQWSTLPNNLLGAIYRRFSSARDRVRFAAVCTRWRGSAKSQCPQLPVIPLLCLNPRGSGDDKTKQYLYCPQGHAVRPRLPSMDVVTAGKVSREGTPPSVAVERWSKLPEDLLCAIYLRLDAQLDRNRFDAVSTSWRATASHPQRRVIPWLILNPCVGAGDEANQHVYCPQDRAILPRLPFLHADTAGRCFVGGHEGGWIASSQPPFKIINLFSGVEVVLSGEQIVHGLQPTISDSLVLRKIIFSEQPTSSGCIIAGITDEHDLAFYMVGRPESGWTVRQLYGGDGLMDIAFCNGELYGTTRGTRGLIKYEFIGKNHGTPVLVNTRWLCMLNNHWEITHEHARYIVELRGKLLMVGSNHNWWSRCLRIACGPRFTVHELVDTGIDTHDMRKYKWVEVHSLGDHALFLGPTCSKAVRVPPASRRRGDVRRNHIYFSHHRCLRQKYEIPNGAKELLATSNHGDDRVYYKVDERGVEGIMSVGYYVMGDARPPMWLFPPDI